MHNTSYDSNLKILTSLAILKTNLKRGHSPIDILVFFLSKMFVLNEYKFFYEEDIPKIISDYKEQFGYTIQQISMKSAIERAKKLHIVNKYHKKYEIDYKKIHSNFDLREDTTKEHLIKQQLIIKDFIFFMKNIFPFKKDFSEESANRIMLTFFKVNNSVILFEEENIENTEDMYFFLKYIIYLKETQNKQYLNIIKDISWSCAIASVLIKKDLIYIKDNSFKDLNILLDSPLLFNLLGTNGKEIEKEYIEFFRSLRKKGIFLYTMDYLVDEIKGILDNAIKLFDSSEYDNNKASKVLKYAKAYESKEFLEKIYINVDETLNRNNIFVKEKTAVDETNYQKIIDNEKYFQEINDYYNKTKNQLNENEDYKNNQKDKKEAINRDIDSIQEIYLSRKENFSNSLLDTKYVFLTNNKALININSKLIKNNNLPATMSDITLAGIMYIFDCHPQEFLDENKLIADCFSYLPIDENIFNNVVRLVKEEIDIEDKETNIKLINSKSFKLFLKDKIVAEKLPMISKEEAEKTLIEFKDYLTKEKDKQINKLNEEKKERDLLDQYKDKNNKKGVFFFFLIVILCFFNEKTKGLILYIMSTVGFIILVVWNKFNNTISKWQINRKLKK